MVPLCYICRTRLPRFFRALQPRRPRHAVLLTRSISRRLPQLLSYKPIALQSPQISFFVSKRLRTLSFSVSCKSCVCHSCENGRVCTNNSRFGSHLALIPKKIGPFFSRTYVEPILQPFCFQIHACNGGVYPPLALPLSSAIPSSLNPIPYPLSFHILAHSFAFFCTHQKLNPFLFKHFRTLYAKQGGWGVMANGNLSCLPRPCRGASRGGASRRADFSSTGHGTRITILRGSIPRCLVTSLLPACRQPHIHPRQG